MLNGTAGGGPGAEAQDLRAGDLGEFAKAGAMVLMRVGQEDVRDSLAAALQLRKKRRTMRLVIRAGIDERDAARADDVAVCPLEREGAWIVGDHTP